MITPAGQGEAATSVTRMYAIANALNRSSIIDGYFALFMNVYIYITTITPLNAHSSSIAALIVQNPEQGYSLHLFDKSTQPRDLHNAPQVIAILEWSSARLYHPQAYIKKVWTVSGLRVRSNEGIATYMKRLTATFLHYLYTIGMLLVDSRTYPSTYCHQRQCHLIYNITMPYSGLAHLLSRSFRRFRV